jgi:myo-inositol-1(or 4)-monophosphatase
MVNAENICREAIEVVREAGIYVRNSRRIFSYEEVLKKGDRDFVTEVDKGSERILVDGLRRVLPHAGFITEEKTVAQSNADYYWVIDPIDGTTNFMHNTPVTAISVALMKGNSFLIGIVYEVTMDELFFTWEGAGASYCNDKTIVVSEQTDFRKALVATGFPYQREGRLEGISKSLHYFLHHCQDIRRFGSAATDLCYVACGRFEVYYEAYLQLWDVAAGILIVRNAGGIVTDFNGNESVNGSNILAANRIDIHAPARQGLFAL